MSYVKQKISIITMCITSAPALPVLWGPILWGSTTENLQICLLNTITLKVAKPDIAKSRDIAGLKFLITPTVEQMLNV